MQLRQKLGTMLSDMFKARAMVVERRELKFSALQSVGRIGSTALVTVIKFTSSQVWTRVTEDARRKSRAAELSVPFLTSRSTGQICVTHFKKQITLKTPGCCPIR